MIARITQTTTVLSIIFTVNDVAAVAADDTFASSTLSPVFETMSQDPRTTARPQPTHELLRRQSQSVVAYVAPDYTVGFVDGRVGATVTCRGESCIASAGIIGGCYNGNSCTYSGVCIDDRAYSSSSACPYGCEIDPNTVKCTYPGPEFCQPHTVPALSAIMYTCGETLHPTVTVETNPAGQNPARVWSTNYQSPLADSTATSGQGSIATSRATGSSDSSAATSTAGSNGSSSSSDGLLSNSGSGVLSTNIIIGIAVGGAAAIAAVVFAGIWYYRRNKRRKQVFSHQQPSVGYNYPPPSAFVPPPQQYHGWQPPKPMNNRPQMAPQNYGHVQEYGGGSTTSYPVSPVSSNPPPVVGRYEIDTSSRPRQNVAELGPGR